VDHERGRWQEHLVSQGYPVRIRRTLVAIALGVAVAVGGTFAASLAAGSAAPASQQSDAVVVTPAVSGS
jgi:hypothetical protein